MRTELGDELVDLQYVTVPSRQAAAAQRVDVLLDLGGAPAKGLQNLT